MYKNNNRKVYFFYEIDDIAYAIEDGTKEVIEMSPQEKAKIQANFFELSENYESNKKSILKYMKDFNTCNDEIVKESKGKINYKAYYNDVMAIKNVFKSKTTNTLKNSAYKIYL